MWPNSTAKLSVNITEVAGCQGPNCPLSYLAEPQKRHTELTMSDENRKPRRSSQDVAGSQTAGQDGKDSPVVKPKVVNQEDGLMPTAENIIRSALSTTGLYSEKKAGSESSDKRSPKDMAKTAGAQIAEATTAAAETVTKVAKDVGTAVSDSAHKASGNLEKEDDSLGPYGNPATCVPSDIDPLAGVVHTGLDLRQDDNGGGENGDTNKSDEPNGKGNSKPE
ncbi:hypothetical protein IWX50DRAFT_90699 [Phyllosticta citricarpa]